MVIAGREGLGHAAYHSGTLLHVLRQGEGLRSELSDANGGDRQRVVEQLRQCEVAFTDLFRNYMTSSLPPQAKIGGLSNCAWWANLLSSPFGHIVAQEISPRLLKNARKELLSAVISSMGSQLRSEKKRRLHGEPSNTNEENRCRIVKESKRCEESFTKLFRNYLVIFLFPLEKIESSTNWTPIVSLLRSPFGHVVAQEISPRLLENARKELLSAVTSSINSQLRNEDGCFISLICGFLFYNLPEREHLWASIANNLPSTLNWREHSQLIEAIAKQLNFCPQGLYDLFTRRMTKDFSWQPKEGTHSCVECLDRSRSLPCELQMMILWRILHELPCPLDFVSATEILPTILCNGYLLWPKDLSPFFQAIVDRLPQRLQVEVLQRGVEKAFREKEWDKHIEPLLFFARRANLLGNQNLWQKIIDGCHRIYEPRAWHAILSQITTCPTHMQREFWDAATESWKDNSLSWLDILSHDCALPEEVQDTVDRWISEKALETKLDQDLCYDINLCRYNIKHDLVERSLRYLPDIFGPENAELVDLLLSHARARSDHDLKRYFDEIVQHLPDPLKASHAKLLFTVLKPVSETCSEEIRREMFDELISRIFKPDVQEREPLIISMIQKFLNSSPSEDINTESLQTDFFDKVIEQLPPPGSENRHIDQSILNYLSHLTEVPRTLPNAALRTIYEGQIVPYPTVPPTVQQARFNEIMQILFILDSCPKGLYDRISDIVTDLFSFLEEDSEAYRWLRDAAIWDTVSFPADLRYKIFTKALKKSPTPTNLDLVMNMLDVRYGFSSEQHRCFIQTLIAHRPEKVQQLETLEMISNGPMTTAIGFWSEIFLTLAEQTRLIGNQKVWECILDWLPKINASEIIDWQRIISCVSACPINRQEEFWKSLLESLLTCLTDHNSTDTYPLEEVCESILPEDVREDLGQRILGFTFPQGANFLKLMFAKRCKRELKTRLYNHVVAHLDQPLGEKDAFLVNDIIHFANSYSPCVVDFLYQSMEERGITALSNQSANKFIDAFVAGLPEQWRTDKCENLQDYFNKLVEKKIEEEHRKAYLDLFDSIKSDLLDQIQKEYEGTFVFECFNKILQKMDESLEGQGSLLVTILRGASLVQFEQQRKAIFNEVKRRLLRPIGREHENIIIHITDCLLKNSFGGNRENLCTEFFDELFLDLIHHPLQQNHGPLCSSILTYATTRPQNIKERLTTSRFHEHVSMGQRFHICAHGG